MQDMQTDVSFTLFLADTTSYVGGELVVETSVGEQPQFKLQAGSMIVYPSTSLHRGLPVASWAAHRRRRQGPQLRTKRRKAGDSV